jgi:hypothetical protein
VPLHATLACLHVAFVHRDPNDETGERGGEKVLLGNNNNLSYILMQRGPFYLPVKYGMNNRIRCTD